MKRAIHFLTLSFAVATISQTAEAAVIVVDPDAFVAGTNISVAFPGVTLSGPGQTNTSVFSLTSGLATTGTRVFGSGDDGIEWGDGFNSGMRVDFAAPASFVSIDIIGNDGSDSGRLLAFDAADMLLGTYTTGGLSTGLFETASITRLIPDIAYVIATGSANGIDSISLDNLSYDSAAIPEPTSMALLGMTAAGFCGVRFRRRRQNDNADTTQAA